MEKRKRQTHCKTNSTSALLTFPSSLTDNSPFTRSCTVPSPPKTRSACFF